MIDREDTGPKEVTGEFGRLVHLADALATKHVDGSASEWDASPLGWIRRVSSAHKRGAIGEELVKAWANSEGLAVEKRAHRGHDCIVDGTRIEVKTSLRWSSHHFAFFDIRDFDYDAAALLGIKPNGFGLWIVPKRLLWENAVVQKLGVSGLGSKWVTFHVDETPAWLRCWGGSLKDARNALRDVSRSAS